MRSATLTNIAIQVPTTIKDLADCKLPENVLRQHGERLIKNINAYIDKENLQPYIENRPKEKQKTAANKESKQLESSKPILIDVPDSNGKFDDGIDYSAI